MNRDQQLVNEVITKLGALSKLSWLTPELQAEQLFLERVFAAIVQTNGQRTSYIVTQTNEEVKEEI